MDLNGILLVDKEVGKTSFETVQLVKRRLGAVKAGHAGTLDKSASGLLIVCVGSGTAVQGILSGQSKRYRGVLYLGIETDTIDRYGMLTKTGCVREYDERSILEVLKSFKGRISQVPPLYSAIHLDGERLYRRARRGETPSIRPREISIEEIRLLDTGLNRLIIEVLASKGTYIRSLARDIGSGLRTCAYLEELRRLESGFFSVEDAYKPKDVDRNTPVMDLNDALSFLPALHVDSKAVPLIRNGIPLAHVLDGTMPSNLGEGCFRIVHEEDLLALGRVGENPSYVKVFGGHAGR